MRIDSESLRDMPLRYQEQVAAAILARPSEPGPVAGGKKTPGGTKVRVKALHFQTVGDLQRYRALRDAVRECVISNLTPVMAGGKITALTFTILWGGEFMPTGVPFADLERWRWLKPGAKVTEFFKHI